MEAERIRMILQINMQSGRRRKGRTKRRRTRRRKRRWKS